MWFKARTPGSHYSPKLHHHSCSPFPRFNSREIRPRTERERLRERTEWKRWTRRRLWEGQWGLAADQSETAASGSASCCWVARTSPLPPLQEEGFTPPHKARRSTAASIYQRYLGEKLETTLVLSSLARRVYLYACAVIGEGRASERRARVITWCTNTPPPYPLYTYTRRRLTPRIVSPCSILVVKTSLHKHSHGQTKDVPGHVYKRQASRTCCDWGRLRENSFVL